MTSKKVVNRSFAAILNKIDNPPIRLVPEKEFGEIAGCTLGSYVGRASPYHKIIAVRYNRPLVNIKVTLWHEIAHILWPKKPHWWIECLAAKMTGGNIGKYSRRYAHNPSELPTKTKCLELAKKRTKLLKAEPIDQ